MLKYFFLFYFIMQLTFTVIHGQTENAIQPAALMTFDENASDVNSEKNQLVISDAVKARLNSSASFLGLTWWQWLLVTAALATLLYTYRQPQLLQNIAKKMTLSPIDKLLRRVRQLANEEAKAKDSNIFYFELSSLLINGLELATNEKLRHFTSAEALQKINKNGSLADNIIAKSKSILTICDNAKFALQIPSKEEQKRTLQQTTEVLQTIKQILHSHDESAAK